MTRFLTLLMLILISAGMYSQEPEQDCINAIAVCQDTFYQPNSYVGYGETFEIPASGGCPGNCMLSGEKNSVWYIFTVQTSGDLGFVITPNNNADDYDWVVYSLNGYSCQDILTKADEMQVSCNWSGTPGGTGPNGWSSYDCQDANGTPYNAMIPVDAGETYVINISNWSSTQFGYLLDFTPSTAEIYDDVAPDLGYVETNFLQCGVDQLTFHFTEKVLCNSVQQYDFEFEGPGGPYTITDVTGVECGLGAQTESEYIMTFDPPIFESGTYSLSIVMLSFIQDACGNNAAAQTLDFDIFLQSFEADAGDDIAISFLETTQLGVTIDGGSGNFSYNWQPEELLDDPTLQDPTTVPLTESTLFTVTVSDENTLCQASDDVLVSIVGGEMSISTYADPDTVCAGDPTTLMANASGGSGTYTYEWTSDPAGFSSDIQSPTAHPMETTTYFVTVNDGYSTVEDQITVPVFPKPVADAGPDQVIGLGTSTTLDGSGSEGSSPYNFQWAPASMIDGPTDIPNPQTVILGAPQNYTLFVTDAKGCPSDEDVVLINASGDLLAAFPQAFPGEICFGESTVLTANATGGAGNYTLTWTSTEPGWSATGDNIEVSPVVTTTYFVEVSDGYTTTTAHIIVPVHDLPTVDLVPPGFELVGSDTIAACVRGTILLDAGNPDNPPNMSYLWSNNWADRYMIAKTNGNWFDIQTYSVQVINMITTCENNGEITVIFDFNHCAIGVNENIRVERPVRIHPNPNEGLFNVSSQHNIASLELKLLTMQGTPVAEYIFENIPAAGWDFAVDISTMPDGLYLLWIKADQSVYTQKIVKN
ncbi:MAG: T9SS type A sorting domain-containing protein [bacterium]